MRRSLAFALALVPLLAGCTGRPATDVASSASDALDPVATTADAAAPPVVLHKTYSEAGEVRVGGRSTIVTETWQPPFATRGAAHAVVEMAWTPTTAATTSLHMEVLNAGTGDRIADVAGPSPLRVTLDAPPEQVEAIFVSASDPGVVPSQSVDLYATLFNGDVPAGYSAVP